MLPYKNYDEWTAWYNKEHPGVIPGQKEAFDAGLKLKKKSESFFFNTEYGYIRICKLILFYLAPTNKIEMIWFENNEYYKRILPHIFLRYFPKE
jgi:hypothetical protein